MTLNIAGVTKTSGPGSNIQSNKPQTKKLGGGLKKLAPPPGFKGKKKGAQETADLLGGTGAAASTNDTEDLLGAAMASNSGPASANQEIDDLLSGVPAQSVDPFEGIDFGGSAAASSTDQSLPMEQKQDPLADVFGAAQAQAPPTNLSAATDLLDL